MKKIVVVLVSLVVAVLIGVGNAFAQDKTPKVPPSIPNPSLSSKWKLAAIGSGLMTVYIDTRRITHLPGGIVKVWSLWVPRGETRRTVVNYLKKNLFSEGKDPNNAKRFWYNIRLDKFNCKTHQYAPLEDIFYSFGKAVLYSHFSQYEEWYDIIPGSVDEIVEKYVCNEAPPSPPIPEPSLSSKWKLVARDSYGSTYYFNTRRITHLPGGIVKVWSLWVPRGELRRVVVNELKTNNAERLWYEIRLLKFNCKTHQFAIPEYIAYSFGKAVLYSHSSQYEEWYDIIPGSVGEIEEKYVCNEASSSIPAPHKPPIPEPSLGPEWKLLGINSDNWSTFYVNTRKITYLPKGIVKVRILWVPRGEFRRGLVNYLKKNLLSRGKDPNNAERLWYTIVSYKVNCKTHQFAMPESIFYSFGKAVLDDKSSQHEEWKDIVPGGIGERLEKFACKKYK